MAPLLKKRQLQQQQQQQQHEQQNQQHPEDHRRPNIWRFMSSRRFGHRSRRNSAGEHDGVQPSGLHSPHFIESDTSDSILLREEADEDEESVGSRYTDARSNWDPPLTSRGHAVSLALSELFPTSDARDSCSSRDGERNLSRPGTARQNPGAGGSVDGLKDDVINLDSLSHHIDAYFTRDSQWATSPRLEGASNHEPFPTEDILAHFSTAGRSMASVREERSDKGKEVDRGLDWSTAINPWSVLDSIPVESNDDDLRQENARLRTELQEARTALSKAKDLPALPADRSTLSSPVQHPGTRPGSRVRRSRQKKRQDVSLFETTTLRDLVLKRVFTPHVIADGIIHDDEQPVTLDTPLSPAQIHEFTGIMNDIITTGSHLKQPIALCAVCHLPKFKGVKGQTQNSYVSEVLAQLPTVAPSAFEDFDPVWGTSRCCRRFVCKTCLSASIIAGIGTQWWYDLTNLESNWLKCPVPVCGRSMPLYSSRDISEALQRAGVRNTDSYTQRFERASRLRSELQALDPLPGRDELRRSKLLHDRLVRNRRMLPMLEDVPGHDTEIIIAVESLPIDTADGRSTLNIPVFTSLLQPRIPQTCVVCDETYREFHRGNPVGWTRAIRSLGGEWTWRIQSFPISEILPECHHEFQICRNCLAQYIAAQLETRGHSVVDNIVCPMPECGHRYTHTEIRHLATPEAFAVYDRWTVLKSISSLPNFRWCLREGCTAGSLYDDPASTSPGPSTPDPTTADPVDANCIECAECGFTMCYGCQQPWHASQTCAQALSTREPSFASTRSWLARHTKPCPGPGCGVQVQKGDGCFHMTCSCCRHEFCWECLADWRGIFVAAANGEEEGPEAGFLRADGHREGCFFRSEEVPLPTQVMGTDLRDGLRRLEERAPGAVEGYIWALWVMIDDRWMYE